MKYLEELSIVPPEMIVYIDECGIEQDLQRDHGRAPIRERVDALRRGRKFRRTNVVAGLNMKNVLASFSYTEKTTSRLFEDWFLRPLLPKMMKFSTVVLDNASFHRKPVLRFLAAVAKIRIIFLPPYSPDLNPIEKKWANLKQWLRDNVSRFKFLEDAIYEYLEHWCSFVK